MDIRDCCPVLSSVDRSRLKASQQWDIVLLGITLTVGTGEVEQSLEEMLKIVEVCAADTPVIFNNTIQSGSLAVLSLSANWLYITDSSNKSLLSRHEIQDISSVGYVKDDGMYILLLKCWQPPGQRYLALAINCLEQRAVSTICKNLRQRFSELCLSDESGRMYSRLSMRVDSIESKTSQSSSAMVSLLSATPPPPPAEEMGRTIASAASEPEPSSAAHPTVLEVATGGSPPSPTKQLQPQQQEGSACSSPGSPALASGGSGPLPGNSPVREKARTSKTKQHGLRWLVKSALRRSSDTDNSLSGGGGGAAPRKKNRKNRGNSIDISSPVQLPDAQRDQTMVYRRPPPAGDASEQSGTSAAGPTAHPHPAAAATSNQARYPDVSNPAVANAAAAAGSVMLRLDSTDGSRGLSPSSDDAVFGGEAAPSSVCTESNLDVEPAVRVRTLSLSSNSKAAAAAQFPLKKRARSIDALNDQCCGGGDDDADFSTLPKKGRRKQRRRASLPPAPSPPGTPPPPVPPSDDGVPAATADGRGSAAAAASESWQETTRRQPDPVYACIRRKSVSTGCLLARTPSPDPPILPARSLDAAIFFDQERGRFRAPAAKMTTARAAMAAPVNNSASDDDDEDGLYERLPAPRSGDPVSPEFRPRLPLPGNRALNPSPPPSILAVRAGISPPPGGALATAPAAPAVNAPWFLSSEDDEDTPPPTATSSMTSPYSRIHGAGGARPGGSRQQPKPSVPPRYVQQPHRPSWYNYNHRKKNSAPPPPQPPSAAAAAAATTAYVPTRVPRQSTAVAPTTAGLQASSSQGHLTLPSSCYEYIQTGGGGGRGPEAGVGTMPTRSAGARTVHKKLVKRVSSHGGRKRGRGAARVISPCPQVADSASVDAIVRHVMASKTGQEQIRYAVGQALHQSVANGVLASNV